MMHPIIERAVKNKTLIFICGTGVSAAVTKGAPTASWSGLLDSGVQRIVDRGLSPNPQWTSLVQNFLAYSAENGDTSSLLMAAGLIKKAFEDHGQGALADWLQADIGDLKVRDPSIAKILTDLPFPILTTNYDKLLEQVGRRGTASWQRPRELHDVVTGKENDIGHLHGVWNDLLSVVLTEQDYLRQASAEGVQALERAISSVKTIVYVGFGSGLTDPNFSTLLEWHRKVFNESTTQHVRLCVESELRALQQLHANDRIEPIAYGPDHQSLGKFLTELAEPSASLEVTDAGIARDAAAEARDSFEAQLRAESILSEAFNSQAPVDQITILPPAILPLPHAEYAKLRSDPETGPSKTKTMERCDPDTEIGEDGFLLLVGEDEAGLTTTLKWLAWRAAENFGASPIYVNFRECQAGRSPLKSRVRINARESGISASKRDPLPDYVLAVDDLSPFTRLSKDVLDDLATIDAGVVLLGCKQGVEEELRHELTSRGVEVRLRFIGRVRSTDIVDLARVLAPSRAEALAKQVVDILVTASLPRTPLTVGLLILILMRGGSIRPNASQTQILEQYVAELLGRGDPFEDARVAVDPVDRELALAHLAKFFVDNETSRVLGSEVIGVFESVFDTYFWSESPSGLLASLVSRRVLKQSGQHVEFSQTYYLYLFAAKHAMADQEFLDRLKEKPLFYAPILTSYAALRRSDEDLVEHLRARFAESQFPVDQGSSFAAVGTVELAEIEEADQVEDAASEKFATRKEGKEAVSERFDPLDIISDESRVDLFLLEENIPQTLLYWRNLEMLSNVVRDSDHIANLQLKQRAVVETVVGWGNLINVLDNDTVFQEAVKGLLDRFADMIDESVKNNELYSIMPRLMPPLMVVAGIEDSLSSRKLLKVLSSAINDDKFSSNEGALGSAFLIYALQEQGWAMQIKALVADKLDLWIVQDFLGPLLLDSLLNATSLTDRDSVALLQLCIDLRMARVKDTEPARRAYATRYRERLERLHLLERGRRGVSAKGSDSAIAQF